MENACVRASWVILTLTARSGRREKTSRGDQGGISREAGKKTGEHNSWGVGGCPTVQCCGEGQCGHTQLAPGFSHTEAIGQEHFLCSDGWGDQAGVILREAGGETCVTMDSINSEQFPWRGEQGNGDSWGGVGGRWWSRE